MPNCAAFSITMPEFLVDKLSPSLRNARVLLCLASVTVALALVNYSRLAPVCTGDVRFIRLSRATEAECMCDN